MRFFTPAGLAIILAVPLIVVLTTRRRRLPVRRVAGVFLWHDPACSAARNGSLGDWSRAALARDVIAMVGLALLACGLFAIDAVEAGEPTRWLGLAGRAIVCVAIASLLLANWRQKARS
jgi:hypothetical protein